MVEPREFGGSKHVVATLGELADVDRTVETLKMEVSQQAEHTPISGDQKLDTSKGTSQDFASCSPNISVSVIRLKSLRITPRVLNPERI